MAQDFEAQKKNKIASPYTSHRDLWDKTQSQIYIYHIKADMCWNAYISQKSNSKT